jgi:tellurium resistance protein TerD
MAINLVKGQTIDLRKNDGGADFDLATVTIGLGWDIRPPKSGGFLGKLLGSKQEDFDLDAVAFLLDSNGKVAQLGDKLIGGDVIFYNSPKHPSGKAWSTGDNRTGAGDGDDEQLVFKLDTLDARFEKIVFVVSIYQGRQKNQHFGLVDNAFIRAIDTRGKEITRFNLSGDATFNGMCSMTFAEVYRKDGSWKFRALGTPHQADSFVEILKQYVNA